MATLSSKTLSRTTAISLTLFTVMHQSKTTIAATVGATPTDSEALMLKNSTGHPKKTTATMATCTHTEDDHYDDWEGYSRNSFHH